MLSFTSTSQEEFPFIPSQKKTYNVRPNKQEPIREWQKEFQVYDWGEASKVLWNECVGEAEMREPSQ